MQEMQEASLGWEDPLEEEMATYSSILAGKSHGQRSLVGYSPLSHKESDMTEQLSTAQQSSKNYCLHSELQQMSLEAAKKGF